MVDLFILTYIVPYSGAVRYRLLIDNKVRWIYHDVPGDKFSPSQTPPALPGYTPETSTALTEEEEQALREAIVRLKRSVKIP